MTSPFTPPSNETSVVPPNRVPPQSASKTLMLWVALIAILFVAYLALGEAPPVRDEADPPPSSEGAPFGLLIPLATYLGMALALLGVRARLPAKYRTGELRELEPPKPEPAAPTPLRPLALSLSGSDGSNEVRLELDDAGLHWNELGRLLTPPRELHVAWSELQTISTGRVLGPLFVWGVLVTGMSLGLFGAGPSWALIGLGVGAALLWVGRRTTRGSLSFSTSTHVLTFLSSALSTDVQDELMNAARARVPQAVAPAAQAGQGVLFVLLVEPFVLLASALLSDDALRARLLRQGLLSSAPRPDAPETDESRAGMVQTRLFAIWRGVLGGLGPLSMALGAGIATADPTSALLGWMLSFVLGLVAVTKTMPLFARFSGMSLMRPC